MDLKNSNIEQEFISSWVRIEMFYAKGNFVQKGNILNMISQMRQHGYDKTLRAGQGMYDFILSRSKQHGLRLEQPRIVFNFTDWHYAWQYAEALSTLGKPHSYPTTIDIYLGNMNSEEKFTISEIKFTPTLDIILKQLASFPID